MRELQSKKNPPFTFDVDLDLYQKLPTLQKKLKCASLSHLVRFALESFNFKQFVKEDTSSKQLSVRLPSKLKLGLMKLSHNKKASLGELLRTAIKALCTGTQINKTRRKTMVTKTPKTTKKPAKKTAIKVVKKATTAVKKVAPKKVTVKAAPKKTKPTKKAVSSKK